MDRRTVTISIDHFGKPHNTFLWQERRTVTSAVLFDCPQGDSEFMSGYVPEQVSDSLGMAKGCPFLIGDRR